MREKIIHCPTKELFSKVQECEFAKGNCWLSGNREIQYFWDDYGEETCISLQEEDGFKMMFSPKEFYESRYPNVPITHANDYLKMQTK